MKDDFYQPTSVVHVPYTFFPEPCGGTEVYVKGLAKRLGGIGYPSFIAAPGPSSGYYHHEGLSVFRFETDKHQRLESAYNAPDEIAARNFGRIVAKKKPSIVHLHGRTSAISERIVDVAHEHGARVVFTYHTPTVSCGRGTMMLYGKVACDGTIERRRCSACTLHSHGVPAAAAAMAARLPESVGALLTSWGRLPRPLTMLRVRSLLAEDQLRFQQFMAKVDHVVAVSEWVSDVLRRNNLPASKMTLSRQGLGDSHVCFEEPIISFSAQHALKLAYFGRVDPSKGLDLLIEALSKIPAVDIILDVYGIRNAGAGGEVEGLLNQAAKDGRVKMHAPVPPEAVVHTMRSYDMIAVPSRWLETGPLVVLEAFAAGVPVIGSRLGGIAELVRHRMDGVLVPSADPAIWASELMRIAADRSLLAQMRKKIRAPRTMDDCASEMVTVYNHVLRRRVPALD